MESASRGAPPSPPTSSSTGKCNYSHASKNTTENTTKNTMIISHIPILSACVFFDGHNMKNEKWEVPGSWMHTDSKQISELFHKEKNILFVFIHIFTLSLFPKNPL